MRDAAGHELYHMQGLYIRDSIFIKVTIEKKMQIWIVIVELKELIIKKKNRWGEEEDCGPLTQVGVDKNVHYLNAITRHVQTGVFLFIITILCEKNKV